MNIDFLSMGNTYGSLSKKFGGSFPAWRSTNPSATSGGILSPLPAVGTFIPSGTMVSLDHTGGTCKIIKSWYAAAVATNVATSIKVKLASIYTVKPVVGDFIMVAPSTVATTGQGAEITAVAVDSNDASGLTYDVTLAATLGTALTTSTILISATNATATAAILAKPYGFSGRDINITEGISNAAVEVVFDGVLFSDRVQPVPDCVKSILPKITLENEY